MVQIRLFAECQWCSKYIDSSIQNYERLHCCSLCKDYDSLYTTITQLLGIAIVNESEIYIDTEWNDLLQSVFSSSLSMYHHIRDDIGFYLGWLYVVYSLSAENNINTIKSSIVCEYLQNLLYFLGLTRN